MSHHGNPFFHVIQSICFPAGTKAANVTILQTKDLPINYPSAELRGMNSIFNNPFSKQSFGEFTLRD
jgi:hypothetical protein